MWLMWWNLIVRECEVYGVGWFRFLSIERRNGCGCRGDEMCWRRYRSASRRMRKSRVVNIRDWWRRLLRWWGCWLDSVKDMLCIDIILLVLFILRVIVDFESYARWGWRYFWKISNLYRVMVFFFIICYLSRLVILIVNRVYYYSFLENCRMKCKLYI